MISLIKAVRDGHSEVVHEYNRYREENPYTPWLSTHPPNSVGRQQQNNQVFHIYFGNKTNTLLVIV